MQFSLCFSLLEPSPFLIYNNTGGMPLKFISSGFKQLFYSALACDDIQTINSSLKAYRKLRQIK